MRQETQTHNFPVVPIQIYFSVNITSVYCVKHVTKYIFGFDVRGVFFFFFAITVVNNRRLIDFVQRLNNLCNLRRNVIVIL